jgi:hypothetical protein
MLTKEDLKEISSIVGDVVHDVVHDVVEKRFAIAEVRLENRISARVTKDVTSNVVSQVGEMLEQNILPQFDKIDERFNSIRQDIQFIKAQMVTRMDLEDRLAHFKLSLGGMIS